MKMHLVGKILFSICVAVYLQTVSVHAELGTPITTSFDGPLGGFDFANDVVVDNNGYVYVGGKVQAASGDPAMWIGKYTSNLTLVSSITVTGITGNFDSIQNLAFDADQTNLYVVARKSEIGQFTNVWVGKYDKQLNLINSATFDAGGDDYGLGICVSGSKIYVVGAISTGSGTPWLGIYDAGLTLLSSTTVTDVGYIRGQFSDVKADENGNIYAAGQVQFATLTYQRIVKFDSNGTFLSSTTLNGSTSGDNFTGIAYDQQGKLYAAGSVMTGSNRDISVAEFNTSLGLLTSNIFDGTSAGYDAAYAITFNPNNHRVYVAGGSSSPENGLDPWVGEYDSSLNLQYQTTITASTQTFEQGLGIAASKKGDIFLTGYIYSSANANVLLARFRSLSSVGSLVNSARAYPNPLKPMNGHVEMYITNLPAGATTKILTLNGGLVREIIADESGTAVWDGKNDAGENVASGVYYVFAKNSDNTKTIKVVVER